MTATGKSAWAASQSAARRYWGNVPGNGPQLLLESADPNILKENARTGPRPLLNLFMNFYWVLRNTLKTQNGHWTICHYFLKEFISDIISIYYHTPEIWISPAGSTGFLHFCSNFFVTAAPSWPCGKKRKPFDLTEGCSHWEIHPIWFITDTL